MKIKKLLIIILFLIYGCVPAHAYSYKEKVEIISGFYKGRTGIVVSPLEWESYNVILDEDGSSVTVYPYQMRPIE